MVFIFALLSIILAFVALFFFQMPMLIQNLPLSWLINYGWKRMAIRILALCMFFCFAYLKTANWQLYLVSVPFFGLWFFSFYFKSNLLFKALNEENTIKNKSPYQSDVEVVGFISKDNTAICYPIYEIVSSRHIINDKIDNERIMITYCPACGSCMVFNRFVQGHELHFEVANGIYRRNMLMMDMETSSIWQQSTGECIAGKMRGLQLDFLSYQQMKVVDWLNLFPNTFFVYEKNNAPKAMFSQRKIARLMNKISTMEGPPNKYNKKLATNEKIWGIEINGYSKAYPVSELKKTTKIKDKIGDVEILINYNPQNNKIEGKEILSGNDIVFQFHRWIGWVEFHQNSEVWKAIHQ